MPLHANSRHHRKLVHPHEYGARMGHSRPRPFHWRDAPHQTMLQTIRRSRNQYQHNKTNPTLTIVDQGPYKYSRNPIYVGYLIAYVGLAMLMNAPIMFATLIVFIYILTNTIIKPEEEYLERKFGEEYLAYKRKIRRWF